MNTNIQLKNNIQSLEKKYKGKVNIATIENTKLFSKNKEMIDNYANLQTQLENFKKNYTTKIHTTTIKNNQLNTKINNLMDENIRLQNDIQKIEEAYIDKISHRNKVINNLKYKQQLNNTRYKNLK